MFIAQQMGQQVAVNQAYAANQPNKLSLLSDSSKLIDRLVEISAKIERYADMLYGNAPTPISAGQKDHQPPIEANLQVNLQTASLWISRIEDGLNRIGNGI